METERGFTAYERVSSPGESATWNCGRNWHHPHRDVRTGATFSQACTCWRVRPVNAARHWPLDCASPGIRRCGRPRRV